MSEVESVDSYPTLLLDQARGYALETEPRWNFSDFPDGFWDWIPDLRRDAAARNENAIAVDCWKYENEIHKPSISQICYIGDDKLETWAKQPVPTKDGEPPRAGLRLVHICYERCPFPKELLAAIAEAFGIPRVELSDTCRESGVCATIFTPDHNHPVFICRGPQHKTAVTSVVRYDPESNITVGYILSGRASEIHYTLLAIPTQFDLCAHPLMIPVLITEQFLEVSSCLVSGVHARLKLIENNTQKKKWVDLSKPAREFHRGNAHWLSNETRSFAFCQAQMHAITLRNDYLTQQLDTLGTWMPAARLGDFQKSTSLLKQRIEYNRSNIEHLKTYLGIEIRLDAQKNLLFNLIAQEDNLVNIRLSREMRQIAIKAKKDGSIMKLIAVLGTIFLPSTFVSTLFAMPLFDWNAPTASQIVGNHFWVYWAATGPLTLLTMILVGTWITVRNGTTTDDDDNNDPPTQPDVDNGKNKIQKGSSTASRRKFWHVHGTENPPNSVHLSHRFDKVIKSALRLRNRYRDITPGTEDEESRIR